MQFIASDLAFREMKSFCSLLLAVFVMGWSCGNSSTVILSLNCSNYVNNLEDPFHPYKTNGSEIDYCTECLCDETGTEATCTEVECPELDCKKVVQEEGKCCKSCDISDNLLLKPDDEDVTHCVVDGKQYAELSLVPSMNTSDPCEVCHCCDKKLLCKSIFEACPKPRCDRSQLIWERNICCPKCPSDPNQPHKQAVVCKQNGFTYHEGDFWSPYYPKLGVIDCMICTCTGGLISCKKLPCPPVRDCTEDDPIEDITLCCPKCNRIPGPTPSRITPTSSPNNTSAVTDANGSGQTNFTVILIPDPSSNSPCKQSFHNVYSSMDSQVDQVAIESVNISNVDVYVWSTSSVMKYESYSSGWFAKSLLNVRFKYSGSTYEGQLSRLKDRFNARRKGKNLMHCQVNCAAKVINILKPCSGQ